MIVTQNQRALMTKTILVIEDDPAIGQGLVDALSFDGYRVHRAADGAEGHRMAVQVESDLVLLDLMLPKMGGLEILKEIRAVHPTLPVIILTARGQEDDRVEGLRLGADDYVVKPFSIKELLARIEAVLRRSPERPRDVQRIKIPGGTIDFERCEVQVGERRCELSQREMDIIRYLACNVGRAVSRDEVLQRVWGMDPRGVTTRTIDMHIARLRDKIELDPANPQAILTVRGKGYKFCDSGAAT